jgi:signal transduction histidine kinase
VVAVSLATCCRARYAEKMAEANKLPAVLCGATLQVVAEGLPPTHYKVVVTETAAPDLQKRVRAAHCFVLLDADALAPPEFLAALEEVGTRPNITPIVISSDSDPKRVVAAMRAGAADYLIRDDDGHYLRELDTRLRELMRAGPPNTPRAMAIRLSQLAHALYHDARNPINNILGFAELLLEIPGTKLSPDQAHFMVRVRSNGDKLLEILHNFVETADRLAGTQ